MTAAKKPANVKAPEDRKPKATAETEATGVESFKIELLETEWEVAADALNDFELMADFATIDRGGSAAVLAMASALPRLLGRAQAQKAMGLLRDPDTGRVSIEAGAEFFRDLFGALDPNS